jgi:hypothetical protein
MLLYSSLYLPSHAFGISHRKIKHNIDRPATYCPVLLRFWQYRQASNPLYRQGNDPIDKPATSYRQTNDPRIVRPTTRHRQTSDRKGIQTQSHRAFALPETLLKLSLIKPLNAAGRQRAVNEARLPCGLKVWIHTERSQMESPFCKIACKLAS